MVESHVIRFQVVADEDESRANALALTAALEKGEGDLVGQWREEDDVLTKRVTLPLAPR